MTEYTSYGTDMIAGRLAFCRSALLMFGFMIAFLMLTHPCMAVEPAWTYPYTSVREVCDISIAPDGSSVIAGAGKVLLFSKKGTLLQKELFGEIVGLTPDGTSVVTAYSTKVYKFTLSLDSEGKPTLKKIWEAEFPEKVSSFSIDEGNRYVVVRPENGDVYLYDGETGELYERWDEYSDLVAVSAASDYIAGISVNQGLKIYLGNGEYDQEFDVPLKQLPKNFFALPGAMVVFNEGQHVVGVNATNGTEMWRIKASDDINMLSMTQDNRFIVAGTEGGGVDLLTTEGDRVWTYQSRIGSGSQGINAVAISADASKILAGSYDGKIILVNKSGTPLWTYTIPGDHIWHVAIASDGSLGAAAGENTMYVFSLTDEENLVTPADAPFVSDNPDNPLLTPGESGVVSGEFPLTQAAVTGTPSEIQTGYTVIRTQAKSPLDPIVIVVALFIVMAYICKRNDS